MTSVPAERRADTRWIHGIASACVLAGTFVLAHSSLHGPPCLFRTMFGLPCPGCGMTRSLESVWHGHLSTSFRFHPLGLPVFLACVALLVLALLPADARGHGLLERASRFLGRAPTQYALVGLVMGVWFLRLGFILAGSRWFLW